MGLGQERVKTEIQLYLGPKCPLEFFSFWIVELVAMHFLFSCQTLSVGMDKERSRFSPESAGCISN